MFLIVHRTGNDLPDASAEFACRVLAKATNRKIYSLKNGIVMKVPKTEGDSEIIRKFFQKYPQYVVNYSRIPNEVECVEYIKTDLGGTSKLGYRFVTSVLDNNRVKYDLIDAESL